MVRSFAASGDMIVVASKGDLAPRCHKRRAEAPLHYQAVKLVESWSITPFLPDSLYRNGL